MKALLALVTFLIAPALQAATLVFENADGRVFHDQSIQVQGKNWSGDWYLPSVNAQGLYARRDGVPSPRQYDCRAPGLGNAPVCVLAGPGRYEILVRAGLPGFDGMLGARYFAY